MSRLRIVTGALPELEDALAEAVAGARQDDPLAPVTVVVGHVLLRPYLRRTLAARGVPQINVGYVRPHELAQQLAGARAFERTRLTPGAERLLVREVVDGAGGYFQAVAGREGFADALGRLFRDLEMGAFDSGGFRSAVERASSDPGANAEKLRELARLYGVYHQRLERFARAADDFRDADPARLEGPLLVYGVWANVRELEARLLERLAAAGAGVTIFLPASDSGADDAVAPFRARMAAIAVETRDLPAAVDGAPTTRLAAQLFREPDASRRVDTGGAVELESAPDTLREVWEAARACLRWAREGIRAHEMAVVYRNREPYRALVDEVFKEAGIETYLHDGRLLSTHPLGRRLLALLDLALDGALHRAEVMAFLTETRVSKEVRDAHGGFRPSEWEAFTREAGVVEGTEQWAARLTSLAAQKRDESRDERFEWLADVADRVDVLRAFIREFAADLAAHPGEAPWDEHLAFLRSIASKYAVGTEPLLDALNDLKTLAAVRPTASFEVFCRAVRDDFESRDTTRVLNEPVRQFGRRGVAVIDASSLRHLRFRAVYMLGVAERAWPPPLRPDPLLLEHERRALNAVGDGAVPLRTQPDNEPLTFQLGVQAARERLAISFARADAGGSGRHLPSYFFRSVVEAIEGTPVPFDDLEAAGCVRRLNAGRLWAEDPRYALSTAEYDRGLVHAALEGETRAPVAALEVSTPGFARAVVARRGRWSASLSAFDGVMEQDAALQAAARVSAFQPGRGVSPSALEMYATCPYRYFLRYTLRVEPAEEPETIDRISPLERGSLVHAILERFLRDLGRDDPPRQERRADHLRRLMAAARDEERMREERGVTGRPMIWEMDRLQVEADLVRWYDMETDDAGGLRPGGFEVSFGATHGNGGPRDTLSRDEPLELRAGGRTFAFRGRIDRLDWDDARTSFRVIDYKTGSSYSKQNSVFDGGRALQLPIYLHAASRALDIEPDRGVSEYFFVSTKGGFKRKSITGRQLDDLREDFETVLETIADGVDGGMFAPSPDQSTCRYCDFKDVCDVRIERIMRRKTADPRGSSFRAMREIE
ncbi:MAG: PD-(D/E)XK nuclease family protein [Dehalococcoidia bacterium]|nr:MAG: PD-(D/E)XK nuclease family protein [Dehalococcoidia bacterium]